MNWVHESDEELDAPWLTKAGRSKEKTFMSDLSSEDENENENHPQIPL